jgi:ubiquitin
MPRRGQVFTTRAVKIIRGLADQGRSASEIADVIGSTPASVRVRCCQLKIKLPRRGRASRSGSRPRDMQERKVAVYVCSDVYAALNAKAAHMQKSPDELAGMLLEAIAASDIYDAVLDQ